MKDTLGNKIVVGSLIVAPDHSHGVRYLKVGRVTEIGANLKVAWVKTDHPLSALLAGKTTIIKLPLTVAVIPE